MNFVKNIIFKEDFLYYVSNIPMGKSKRGFFSY